MVDQNENVTESVTENVTENEQLPASEPVQESVASPETVAPEAVAEPVQNPTPTPSFTPDVPTETEEQKKKCLTKNAYNKAGLSILVLYFAMQMIGSVAMAIIIVPAVILTIVNMDFSITLDMGSIQEVIAEVTYLMTKTSLGFWIMFGVVVGTGIGLAISILLQKAISKSVPASPIQKRTLSAKEYLVYLFTVLGLWAIGVFVGNFQTFFGVPAAMDSFFTMFEGKSMIPYLVYGIIGAPVLEELALRKVLLDKLHGYGEVTAALTSALMFGLIHGNSAQFFLAFNVGLLLAVVYMKTGHVGYTMLFHVTINFIGTLPEVLSLCGINGIGTLDFNSLLFILLAVFAVIGPIVLIINRKSELFTLTRSDCPDFRRAMLANPGMLIYPILATVMIVGTDLISVFSNLLSGVGAKSLWTLVPMTMFIVAIVLFYALVGRTKKTKEPVEFDTTIE